MRSAPLFRTQPPQAIPPPPPTTRIKMDLSPPHGQLPCPLAVGCISNTPSQPVVSGSGSASSSCFCFSVCFHLPKCVFFCAPSVSYINTLSCVLFALCSGLPLISSAVFLCACSYPRYLLSGVVLASALGLFWVLSGLPRSHAGAVAVNKGRHQLTGGIIGEVQAETCVILTW